MYGQFEIAFFKDKRFATILAMIKEKAKQQMRYVSFFENNKRFKGLKHWSRWFSLAFVFLFGLFRFCEDKRLLKGIKKDKVFFKFKTSMVHILICVVNVTSWSCLLRGFKLKKTSITLLPFETILGCNNKKGKTQLQTSLVSFFEKTNVKLVNSRLLLQFCEFTF